MSFEPWMLAAMEEVGYMDTKKGHINRVANYLSQSQNSEIGAEEFQQACQACHVAATSFTQEDMEKIAAKIAAKLR